MLVHKLNLKELPPSDWLALASSNKIASVEKTLDSYAVLVMLAESENFREMICSIIQDAQEITKLPWKRCDWDNDSALNRTHARRSHHHVR
jgi:hypothetical protein